MASRFNGDAHHRILLENHVNVSHPHWSDVLPITHLFWVLLSSTVRCLGLRQILSHFRHRKYLEHTIFRRLCLLVLYLSYLWISSIVLLKSYHLFASVCAENILYDAPTDCQDIGTFCPAMDVKFWNVPL